MSKLGELLSIKHGWAFKGEYFADKGKQSILTPGNFYEKGGFKKNDGKERYYTGNYPPEYLCRKGDLIIVMTEQAAGLLGSTAIVPEDNRYLHNQRIGLVSCNSGLDKLYAYYLFMTKSVREQISRTSSGTKVKHTSPEKIYDVEVSVPNIKSQRKIANVLWKIDGKIRVNNAVNDILQQMAYETYMHHFFSKSPSGKIGDIIVENSKSSIQVGEAKTVNSGLYPFFTSGEAVLKWPSFLVSGRNCYLNTGGNADVKFYIGEAAYSTDTWCITAENELEDYLYLMLFSMKQELNQKFFQGTGIKHLQKPLLKDRPIYIPNKSELIEFNKDVQPWFDMIATNTRENYQLIDLRDWLLPILMNGQVTITDQ